MVGSEKILAMQFVRLEEVEHFQHGKALRRRRRVEHRDVAIAADERLAPTGSLPAEIGEPEQAAARFGEPRHLGGDRSLVKAFPAIGGDRLQRARQIGVGDPCARGCRGALWEEQRGGLAVAQEIVAHHLDETGKAAGDRKAVAGVGDGAFQNAGKRQPPVGGVRFDPARHGTRHRQRRRHDAAQRNLVQPARRERVQCRALGRLATAIEVANPAARTFVKQPERVAPEPRHVRIDHREHRAGRDRRVDRGAAGAEHVEAGG